MRGKLPKTIAIVCLVACVPAAFAQGVNFDFGAFDKLGVTDRLSVFLTGLNEHESALDNLELKISAQATSTTPAATSAKHQQIVVRAVGPKYYMQLDSEMEAPGHLASSESVKAAWDGEDFQTWKILTGNPIASGIISTDQSGHRELDPVWWYMDQLGTHRQDAPQRTITNWIHFAMDKYKTSIHIDVETIRAGDEKTGYLKFTLQYPPAHQRYEYVVDPSRQFVIMHYSLFQPETARLIDVSTSETREVQGVYIPSRVIRTITTEAGATNAVNVPLGKYSLTTTYELTECQLGNVKESDLRFDFPPGTRVLDQNTHKAYQVLKDGTTRSEPVFNAKTGRISGREPSTAPATQPLGKD